MRLFILSLFFVLLSASGFAAPLTKSAPKSVPAPIQNAAPVPKWIDVDAETRGHIVDGWLKLDEATRPPFPIFRDQWLRSNGKPALPGAAPVGMR